MRGPFHFEVHSRSGQRSYLGVCKSRILRQRGSIDVDHEVKKTEERRIGHPKGPLDHSVPQRDPTLKDVETEFLDSLLSYDPFLRNKLRSEPGKVEASKVILRLGDPPGILPSG